MKRKIRLVPCPLRRFGICCPRPEATVAVRTHAGSFSNLRFLVDTGADVTTIPADRARAYGIPFDSSPGNRIPLTTAQGSAAAYRGEITVRLLGGERTWPCAFTEQLPPSSPPPTRPPRLPPSLLGRAGFRTEDCQIQVGERYLTVLGRGLLVWLWPLVSSPWPVDRPI